MCRHIYDWNTVNCDVKQPIYHYHYQIAVFLKNQWSKLRRPWPVKCWPDNWNILKYWLLFGYCFTPYQRLWLYNGAPLGNIGLHYEGKILNLGCLTIVLKSFSRRLGGDEIGYMYGYVSGVPGTLSIYILSKTVKSCLFIYCLIQAKKGTYVCTYS